MSKENYTILEEDIIDFFNQRLDAFSFPVSLKFHFQAVNNLKHLIKISKIPDQYSVAMGKDVLIQINQDYFDAFSNDEELKTILFDREIDKIQFDMEKGTFKIGKTNFEANIGIIEKYTYDSVQRAVEMEKTYEKQKNESEKEKELSSKPKSNKKWNKK